MSPIVMAKPELSPIPIPNFTGKIWEFENFWALFEANVHSQPLTDLQKFNYLLRALKDEARDLVRRYPVTENNYKHAIELLRTTYGDNSKLVKNLQFRLEKAAAKGNSIEEQRQLWQYVMPIVSQLQEKGIYLDGSFLAHKILSKFSTPIQRRALELRVNSTMNENSWKLSELLSDIDHLISTEEKIRDMLESNPSTTTNNIIAKQKQNEVPNFPTKFLPCLFCNMTNHKSVNCIKVPTTEERTILLKQQKRCLNCVREGHFSKDCPRLGCKQCQGKKHHYSICPQNAKPTGITRQRGPPGQQVKTFNYSPRKEKPKLGENGNVRTNLNQTDMFESLVPTEHQETQEGNTILHMEAENTHVVENNVLLLTGVAKVKKPRSDEYENIKILLDTGADRSFITSKLYDELNLRSKAKIALKMYTFGTAIPKKTVCDVTNLEIWDEQWKRHELRLCKTTCLTAKTKTIHLSEYDLDFIRMKGIQLSKAHIDEDLEPQILLGCDQLWSLLDVLHPQYTLPSGLILVPSKLGYLLSGCGKTFKKDNISLQSENIATTQVNTSTNFEEELDEWDHYWSIDSSGIEEYTGTKNSEKEAINKKVNDYFKKTIEKRNDGYYVRLPYKENHPKIPDNKMLAHRRLISVWRMLQGKPELLQEYNKTFVDQLRRGVLEEVPNNGDTKGEILHYLPHQPVLTPQKETTKLRVVFDASSHYKNSPSLNDILHQGPLILPDIYGMLLRFRETKFAIISDVEKAFLQVRLHEEDRDATRCMWVRNLHLPLQDDNIIIYRFTRVTFGLNVSPFLLGGTIQFHLDNEVMDRSLAYEIKNNLYVDNLILSAETTEETCEKSLKARKVFEDMNMNLREFLSNERTLKGHLPEGSYTNKLTQKVLGITWDSEKDLLQIKCDPLPLRKYTKRSIAQQIASIYDPLGWLVPLLLPAKLFQQKLWLAKYDWDEELADELCKEWEIITTNMTDFSRYFPRRFYNISNQHPLAVFADASTKAIAACAYIFNTEESSFLMGKSKLPSIKTKTTIPKLEMNAITIAARLALSIHNSLKDKINFERIVLFSDSQIVLGWINSPINKANMGVLVCNRLKEIRNIAQELQENNVRICFSYVSTGNNPADIVTRLVHLEVVKTMGTNDFLNAIRRFFSRRGVPETITCDNAPTFLLSSEILSSATTSPSLNAETARLLADNEIQWIHITPYAPWQGGFYERLIQSVKHSLYKCLRGTTRRSCDDIITFITEVEACLNSRPLTYQESALDDISSIRPIDFIQKDMNLTFPFEKVSSDEEDKEYLPSDLQNSLKTRKQAEETLKSSYQLTERFWKIWENQYILNLREQHQKRISQKQYSTDNPEVGSVVLISDPILPRNKWKMARITKTCTSTDGKIREVELVTSTKQKIRRPINLLIPLELNCEYESDVNKKPEATKRSHRDNRLAAALVISINLLTAIHLAKTCQEVNILDYHTTICTTSEGRNVCKTKLSEILKVNTFHQEACMKLVANNSIIANVKIRWHALYLHCDRETMYFTRSAETKIIDSKRCPHMGSCTGEKCGKIQPSTLLPELREGNRYPGRTGCLESCGGPGCDCFYLSSGCLFFRIYAKPKNQEIYEIFRCMRWTEEVKLEVSIENYNSKKQQYIVPAIPNVPQNYVPFTITMTSLTLPPTPVLNDYFVTNENDTIIWNTPFAPTIHCKTRLDALWLTCDFHDQCSCGAAENNVICDCPTHDIASEFEKLSPKLPVKRASVEFRMRNKTQLIAKIPQMVTAEFIIDFKGNVDLTQLQVENNDCKIESSLLQGCYRCAKGAQAKIQCTSKSKTMGEITCDQLAMDRYREELRKTKSELNHLKNAIPHLPTPQELRGQIIEQCMRLPRCLREVDTYGKRLQRVQNSSGNAKERNPEITQLETLSAKLRAELDSIRFTLRVLHATAPLLIATKAISNAAWEALIDEPAYDINDEPLLMKRKDVEKVIDDQIRQLQEKQAILENVRNELTFEENEQARNFQEAVMDALRTIHSSILTLQEDQRKRLELFQEHQRIANNARFAESIQIDEDAYDDEPRYWREQEIAHLERRIDELDDMISVLESAKKCEPRAFVEGVFHEEERRMQCVFCEAIGQHYSDSC
ncbi:zinc knuckle, partial [Ancylostoma duodenale]